MVGQFGLEEVEPEVGFVEVSVRGMYQLLGNGYCSAGGGVPVGETCVDEAVEIRTDKTVVGVEAAAVRIGEEGESQIQFP